MKKGFFKLIQKQHNNQIRVTRQSVCMGDDCTAPNEKLLDVEKMDMLSDILKKAARCLPQMPDVIWAVDSGKNVVGYIIMDKDIHLHYELCREDKNFLEMGLKDLHCSYFHQKSFIYRDGANGEIIEKYPECKTLPEKVRYCMNERFQDEFSACKAKE